ncbi:hypothetical protein [Novosphingobium sp. Chol11]|uniref:hypothetical protein n=1 Tax=Novosphingobium sp. Chol11 TaxID=1385763 RepID=UPI000BE3DA75|nr:hypothetical protein [Novosphingobium sp. Chol11]
MLLIPDSLTMRQVIDVATNDTLRDILMQRLDQLGSIEGYDLGDLAHFIIMQSTDNLADLDAALGFSVLDNFVDRTPYGDPDFIPSTEWIADHGSWYELTYVLTDDGFGWGIFVPKAEGMDERLLAMCAEFSVRDAEGQGRR